MLPRDLGAPWLPLGFDQSPLTLCTPCQELPRIRQRILDELRAEGVDIDAACKYCDARDLQVRCTAVYQELSPRPLHLSESSAALQWNSHVSL